MWGIFPYGEPFESDCLTIYRLILCWQSLFENTMWGLWCSADLNKLHIIHFLMLGNLFAETKTSVEDFCAWSEAVEMTWSGVAGLKAEQYFHQKASDICL